MKSNPSQMAVMNIGKGHAKSLDELNIVIDAINNNLRNVFGVAMQPAEYEVRTLDGKKVSETMH